MLKIFDKFLNLFHRKQRFTPQYSNLTFLKKLLFYGSTGFVLSLSISKFIYSNLLFAFEPTESNRFYIKLIPALERGVYHPNMLMLVGIFQRLYAKYREEETYLRINQEQIDGNSLSWVVLHDKAYQQSSKKKKEIPLVVVVTGSQGVDNTVRSLLLATYNLGYRVVAVDPADFHNLDKFSHLLNNLQEKYPQSQMLGLGVEYGANLLVNFAAKNPNTFKGLVSIGNPFDLIKSEITLQNSWLWTQLYRSILKGKLQKAQRLNKQIKVKDLSLFQLDKQAYHILDEDYLIWKRDNSSVNHIKDLKVPALFIQSKQDPFSQQVGDDQRYQNEKCIYVTTQRGGHNQWFENLWMNRWAMAPVKSFLKLVHDRKIQKIVASNPPTPVTS